MSLFLKSVIARAKADKKTIVLPEGNDRRTLEAAERILSDDYANLIILGDSYAIDTSGYVLEGAHIVDPRFYRKRDELAEGLYQARKHKGVTEEQAEKLLEDPLYFGVMLVKAGYADGMVAGACHYTADVLRPSLQILKTAPDSKLVSAFFVMCTQNRDMGYEGSFVFADCGLNVNPTAEELAHIAISSAKSFTKLVRAEPIVAFLSHSTKGSAKNEHASKVVEAARIAKELEPDMMIDGEMQLDAALIPEVADLKAPGSYVAGRANVLVFPDLDAGNIGYKLVHRLGNAEAYGPVTQGIAAPVNDLSRGCNADGICGVVAITCVQAHQN